ncbi:MAG: hypothetical protein EBZ96_09455 [Synechococcaceae bacterium WB9_3_282]|nr:hypothetical protein [Synechococcaceae bacterium WB9_3_282]
MLAWADGTPCPCNQASAWLCEQPSGEGACGQCGSCHAVAVRTHADLCVLMPETLMLTLDWPLGEKVQSELDSAKRKPSKEIKAEAMRDAIEFSQRTSARGRGKVVLVYPAERMNHVTANGLLKTLEEPGQGLLILLTAAPEQLLSTILSRCMRISFRPLAPAELAEVVPNQGDPAELLALAAGSPGALLEWRRRWQELPEALLVMPENPMAAMDLARQISDQLDSEQQLWLIGLLQRRLWLSSRQVKQLQRLERLGKHLKGNVQPRLAWEVALLDLCA